MLPEFLNVHSVNVNIVDEYFVIFGRKNPWYQVHERSLAAADRSGYGNFLSRDDIQVYVLQDNVVMLIVSET